MDLKKPFTPRDWLAVAALLGLALVLLSNFRFAAIDDSYIYLRVADNILHGNGWVFNIGERVNACTSPLYTMLLALIRVFVHSPDVALVACYGIGLIAIVLIQYVALRAENRALAFAMAVVSVTDSILFHSIAMETTLFLSCILAAAWAYQKNAYALCGMFCAFSALNRPEGLALIFIISAIHAYRTRAGLLRAQITFAAVLLPWLIFSRLYFGHFLSNSISAKAAQSAMGAIFFHMNWGAMLVYRMLLPWVTIPLALAGAFLAIRRIKDGFVYFAIPVLFGIVQIAAYAIFRAPFNYRWYYAPADLAINMCVVLAIYSGWHLLQERVASAADSPVWAGVFVVAVLLLLTRLGAAPFELPRPYESEENYTAIGNWIKANSSSDDRVACMEIGYVGYFSQRRILDIAGLIHPQALKEVKRLNLLWWFDPQNLPEFIVVHRIPWPGEPDPRWGTLWQTFKAQYTSVYEKGPVLVFRRN